MASPAQRRIELVALVILVSATGIGGWQSWLWWNRALLPVGSESSQIPTHAQFRIHIPQGASARQIGQHLRAAGLIRSTRAWLVWIRWLRFQDPSGGLQAGTYDLSPQDSLPAIAEQIWQGDVVQINLTVPEGWSIERMAQEFESQGLFTATDFIAATRQIPYDRYPWLPQELTTLEGFLFPETYQFNTTVITPEAVITQMLDQFERVALPIYQQSQPGNRLSLYDWVILASIVEKEAVVASERSLIAGVFANRLRQGIPLGADPTVEYGLGIRQTPDQPLTLTQVQTPSPYNTYLNAGLPPTPIASPSLASLNAAAKPAQTPYLYFVARYDGTHVFSRTLKEHEKAQAAIRDERDGK